MPRASDNSATAAEAPCELLMNGEPDAGATADALNAEAVGRGWRREIFRRPLRETMVVGEKWVRKH